MRLFKTFGRGLFRLTLGITGIGASVGAGRVRVGRSPSGRRRASLRVGKGISIRKG